MTKSYQTLSEFYPVYLSERTNRTAHRLHFVGATIAIVLLIITFITQFLWLIAIAFM